MDEPERDDDPIDEAFKRAAALPSTAIAALFARYGKPIDVELPPRANDDRHLALAGAGGDELGCVRIINVRMPVDVIGNDWFVLEAAGAEPLAMAGPLFASAIAALTRAAQRALDNTK